MDSSCEQATLQLVALDSYNCKLVTMMLDMLNARLTYSWSSSWPTEGAIQPATSTTHVVLADVDTPGGLACVQQRINAGLATRTIALGSDPRGHGVHVLQKPMRLHSLLASLTAVESGEGESLAHYRLREWPVLDAHTTASDELRIYSILTRRSVSIAETARLLGLAANRVAAVVARLSADKLVECSTVSAPALQPPAVATNPGTPGTIPTPGLLGMLRRRFGL